MSSTPFALGTFATSEPRSPLPGLVVDETVVDLRGPLGSNVSIRSLIDRWDEVFPILQRIADELPAGAVRNPLAALEPLPPLTPSGQVFQAAANYRKHVLDIIAAAEVRNDASDGLGSSKRAKALEDLTHRARHGRPFVFMGSSHAIVGAHDDVVLPAEGRPDWELELAAVIGRAAHDVPVEQALDHVAGYTICNDLTLRDALHRDDASSIGIDWLAGKNPPTFLPTGPLLVPAAHAGNVMDLRIELRVNGRVMQDESTADMLFGVAEIISHISRVAQLQPGDLVLTGSPAGNGAAHGVFLREGDLIEGTISGLGTQRNRCVAAATR